MKTWRVLRSLLEAAFVVAAVSVCIVYSVFLYVRHDLPDTTEIRSIRLQTPLKVFSSDGTLIAVFGDMKRTPLRLENIPQQMIDAFISAEDDDFFNHHGVDFFGLARAAWVLFWSGEKRQGGSTITMQFARNFFLSTERTYERKIKEIFLALLIERQFEKEKILSLYLNKIFLGHRAYGVGAASLTYYGVPPVGLTLAQTAMIAGLPKAPSIYNPLTSPEYALQRRNYVLRRMLELEKISDDEYREAVDSPVTAKKYATPVELRAPFFAESIRKEMLSRYGREIYTDGYEVHATMLDDLQVQAELSLRKALLQYDARHGYRGAESSVTDWKSQKDDPQNLLSKSWPIGGLLPAIVVKTRKSTADVVLGDGRMVSLGKKAWEWARPQKGTGVGEVPERAADVMKAGDLVRVMQSDSDGWVLRQVPVVSGALISVKADDGAVLAMVGGFDFGESEFNHALQARRQPGSGFKPIIYSAILKKGYTPATIVKDLPIVYDGKDLEPDWRPGNYTRKFSGPIRLRKALSKSRNLVSVRLGMKLGVPEILDSAKKFGFSAGRYRNDMTIALGSGEVLLSEMAAAYAVFANGGSRVFAHLVKTVTVSGEIVYSASVPDLYLADCASTSAEIIGVAQTAQYAPRVLDPAVAYQMTTMLHSVIRSGTGKKARVLRRGDIAGKTGTTNDFRDAWFTGFNRDLVTSVWVGFDDYRTLGKRESGSLAALPMWIDYMRHALAAYPERQFCKPGDIVTLRVNAQDGLLSNIEDPDSMLENFRREFAPREFSKKSVVNKKDSSPENGQLF